jgi:hypothetical protein
LFQCHNLVLSEVTGASSIAVSHPCQFCPTVLPREEALRAQLEACTSNDTAHASGKAVRRAVRTANRSGASRKRGGEQSAENAGALNSQAPSANEAESSTRGRAVFSRRVGGVRATTALRAGRKPKKSKGGGGAAASCSLCGTEEPADLCCKVCNVSYHSLCIGLISPLIPNVAEWTCSRCAEPDTLNYATCYLCGTGGNLVCCENCPRSFHANCSGVKSGLKVVRSTSAAAKANEAGANPDWCNLCKVACPKADSPGYPVDIFSVSTRRKYDFDRALLVETGPRPILMGEILRHLELICTANFFQEIFFAYWEIWKDRTLNNLNCTRKIISSIGDMMGWQKFHLVFKQFSALGTRHTNAFIVMGGRGYGWQMCPGCHNYRVLRTMCIHCGKSYRKDLASSPLMSCERFLYIPAMPKKTQTAIDQFRLVGQNSSFENEKKVSIRRALKNLVDNTEKTIAKEKKAKRQTIPEIGTIVFLHYQAYVNLKDISLRNQALENYKNAATIWLNTPGTFGESDSDEFEENLNNLCSIALDCTQGLCALRWGMCHGIIDPCTKHGRKCPFLHLSVDPQDRPYEYANVQSNDVSCCPYERALQLEYQVSLIDEGEFYNDSTSWDHDHRYPVTPSGQCMRCDKKIGKKGSQGNICCNGKPPLRTIDYSTCYDYLIWGYCFQVIGIDAFKFNLDNFLKKLPVIRSYGTFEELGHRVFLHQCYFITHFIYAMSEWGRHRLCINKFWEEFAFIVENIKLVANHIQDFEVLGEFLNCLGIIGVAAVGEEKISELVRYGQACLLQVERGKFKKSGQWVPKATSNMKDQFHSAWCGLVGLTDYPARGQGRHCPPLHVPPFFLGGSPLSVLATAERLKGTLVLEITHRKDEQDKDSVVVDGGVELDAALIDSAGKENDGFFGEDGDPIDRFFDEFSDDDGRARSPDGSASSGGQSSPEAQLSSSGRSTTVSPDTMMNSLGADQIDANGPSTAVNS